jgi:hypothetical protein
MPLKPELQLRRQISKAWKKLWISTWHEDGDVNPGVPDISYVPVEGNCETGWLELKAEPFPVDPNTSDANPDHVVRFKFQPAQHIWIDLHLRRVPIHILAAIGCRLYIFHGDAHRTLAKGMTLRSINSLSITNFLIEEARDHFHILVSATKRSR